MRFTDHRKRILSFLCYALLSIVFHIAPVYAEELQPRQAPARNIKGFWEVNLYTQTTVRTVVEETRGGVNVAGDAESTRVVARLATKPWRPFEIYLQAGTANLNIDDIYEYRGDYSLAYGGGFSQTLYDHPGPRKFQVITQGDIFYSPGLGGNVLAPAFNVVRHGSPAAVGGDIVEEEI